MRISDLQTKKIIDIQSGKNIGNIIDVEIKEDGKVEAFMIEQNKSLFSLNREGEARIYWSDIAKVGEDVILVKKN